MTPTIVLQQNQPIIVVGTPGGTTIPTSVFQTLVNLLEFNMSPEDAVNKPKFHHQWLPETVSYEKNFPESTIKELETMGYVPDRINMIGRVELIKINENGTIDAVADGRGDDSVAIE